MVSINSFELRRKARTAARSVAEAAVVGAAALWAASRIWHAKPERDGLLIGGICAWAASSISTTALLASKASDSPKPFWWAFGGGMGLRLATLAALMAYGYTHDGQVSQPALLLAYALGVLFFLLLEYRHIKLK